MAGWRKMVFTQWPKEEGCESGLEACLALYDVTCRLLAGCASVVYYALNCEVGKTGKHHIHGYVCFESPVMFSRLKKVVKDNRIHIEAARGTPDESLDYLRHTGKHQDKVGEVFRFDEHGQKPKDGAGRPSGAADDSSYAMLIDGLIHGLPDAELMQRYPGLYIKHYGNITRLRQYLGLNHYIDTSARLSSELSPGYLALTAGGE